MLTFLYDVTKTEIVRSVSADSYIKLDELVYIFIKFIHVQNKSVSFRQKINGGSQIRATQLIKAKYSRKLLGQNR